MRQLKNSSFASMGFASGVLIGGLMGYEWGLNDRSEKTQPETPSVTSIVPPEQIVGRFVVSDVVDGDTIKVAVPDMPKGTATIRIVGMNAPESRPNQGRPVQCFAKEATAEASRLLLGEEVELVIDPIGDRVDANGRPLRKVDMDTGPAVNDFAKEMVRNGFAAAYRRYSTSDRKELIALELSARTASKGLWDACKMPKISVPPNTLGPEVTFPPARS